MLGSLFPDAFWTWVERISWWTAIVGFPVGIAGLFLAYWQLILLRRDQRRIADELAKAPRLEVGFDTAEPPEVRTQVEDEELVVTVRQPNLVDTIDVEPVPGGDDTVTIDVRVETHNAGDRTAHNLLWNYSLLPLGVEAATAGTKWLGRRDTDGPFRLITTSDRLHPDVVEPHGMRLQIPTGIPKVFIHYSARCDELPAKRGLLVVRIL